MANKLDAAIPRRDMTINEGSTTPAANSRCSDSAGSRIVKRDRPWHLYPNGTKAVAPNGGHYLRETGGWKWCAGDLFPRPSADVDRVILPENASSDARR